MVHIRFVVYIIVSLFVLAECITVGSQLGAKPKFEQLPNWPISARLLSSSANVDKRFDKEALVARFHRSS
jgi:hypothetical protein